MRQVTAEEVRTMREESGMGMMECKKILLKNIMREACAEAQTVDDLRPIILQLIDMAH